MAHAGAGPVVLRPAFDLLPPWVEVVGVTLPGRERRLAESCVRTASDPHRAVADVVRELDARPRRPTVLFGHSAGAAFATSVALARAGGLVGLVLSAPPRPGSAAQRAGRWTDEEILAILRLGGVTPETVLRSRGWRRHMLEIMRCDLTLAVRLGSASDLGGLGVALTVLGGNDDVVAARVCVRSWAAVATAVRTRTFPGGHFYLLDEDNRAGVAQEIVRALARAPMASAS